MILKRYGSAAQIFRLVPRGITKPGSGEGVPPLGATRSSSTETTIDASSPMSERQRQESNSSDQLPQKAIIGFSQGVSIPAAFSQRHVPAAMGRPGGGSLSLLVQNLQLRMHDLITKGQFKEATDTFENFINSAFVEAKTLNVKHGYLPPPKKPREYQWLQYIQALSKRDQDSRVAMTNIQNTLNLMKQIGIAPRSNHYRELLFHIRRLGRTEDACRVINEMNRIGVKPDPGCYELAIFCCLANRDLNSTSRLLDDLFRTPTAFERRFRRSAELLYTKVVLFCASLKRIDNAFVFMKQMSNLNLMIPIHLLIDVACHAADVDDSAAVETILQDLNDLTRIVQLGDNKKQQIPIKLDEGILLSYLNCAARTGVSTLADQVWEMIKYSLQLPYHHEISFVAKDMSESQNEEVIIEDPDYEEEDTLQKVDKEAGEKKDESWKESLKPYLREDKPMVVSYHAYIQAHAKAGNIDRAFEALLELEETHPDNPSDLSPAQGLCMLVDELAKDANTVDQAYLLLDEWHKEGKKVTVPMLDVIVSACSRMGDANRAFETFEAYSQLGLSHRVESYNALMEVCASQKQVEVIMKLLQEMAKAEIKPNVDTYMQIIEGYISINDTTGIAHSLSITKREGFTPTLRVLERAYECAEKNRDEQTKHLIRRELLTGGQTSNLKFDGARMQGAPRGGRVPGMGRLRYRGPVITSLGQGEQQPGGRERESRPGTSAAAGNSQVVQNPVGEKDTLPDDQSGSVDQPGIEQSNAAN